MLRVGNKTQGWATAVVEIDVDYFADLDQVRALLAEAAARVVDDPVVGTHVLGEPTITGIERLSADAVTLRLKVKTSPAMQWEVARELRTATRDALERADVPLAGQRDLMATHRAGIAPERLTRTGPATTRPRRADARTLRRSAARSRAPPRTRWRRRGAAPAPSGRQAQSSSGSPAWTVSPSATSMVSASGSAWSATTGQMVCQPGGGHVDRRPGHEVVAGADGLAAVDVQREALPGEADGVDAEVDEDGPPLAQLERERVRVQRADHAVRGRDDGLGLDVLRLDGHAGADHALREHRVGHGRDGPDDAGQRAEQPQGGHPSRPGPRRPVSAGCRARRRGCRPRGRRSPGRCGPSARRRTRRSP